MVNKKMMLSKKMQGIIMISLGSVLFLAIVGNAFFKVFFAIVGIFLVSYGLHLMNKPGLTEYAQRLFNSLKS